MKEKVTEAKVTDRPVETNYDNCHTHRLPTRLEVQICLTASTANRFLT